MKVCQSCGKPIKNWEKAVAVRYGNMSNRSVQNFLDKVDFFHLECDKAFRKIN